MSDNITPRHLAHKLWIRSQREKYKLGCPDDGNAKCENCYCIGNSECGHAPADEDDMCTLMGDSMICPCCSIEPNPATDADVDKARGQMSLFCNGKPPKC